MGRPQAKQYPAARSAGTLSHPAAHYVRFTEEQNARVHQAAALEGKSIQGFLHDAGLAAVDDCLRRQAERASLLQHLKGSGKRVDRDALVSDPPRGFGLRRRLAERPRSYEEPLEDAPAPPPAPTPTPQIVINNGPVSAASPVDALAAWIAKDPNKRDVRLATATEILTASAGTDAERAQLAKALDDKLTALGASRKKSALDVFDSLLDSFLGRP